MFLSARVAEVGTVLSKRFWAMIWDGVVFWFGFGQGVNKSGVEALVTSRPVDNISGSGYLTAKPKYFCDFTVCSLKH